MYGKPTHPVSGVKCDNSVRVEEKHTGNVFSSYSRHLLFPFQDTAISIILVSQVKK